MRIAIFITIVLAITVSMALSVPNSFAKTIHQGQWTTGPAKIYQNQFNQNNNRYWPPDPCLQAACAGTSSFVNPGAKGKRFPPNPIKMYQ